jgi:membrane-bound lytic murein transglycosylase A
MLALLLGLLAAAQGLARLEPGDVPNLFDNGDTGPLLRNLRAQVDWYTSLERDASWPLGDETVSASRLQRGCLELLRCLQHDTVISLNELVRERFDVWASAPGKDTGRALFTGYYNPVFRASLAPDSTFRWPLYRLSAQGRRPTRAEIDDQSALAGQGLEIAWLADPFDRYEVHIEGSATLVLPDGSTRNAHYAGTNGHPYRSLGRALIDAGVLSSGSASMDGIRRYFQRHPFALQRWLNTNPSYCFFRLGDDQPSGSLGLPLVPERTLALDDDLLPPGLVCWFAVRVPEGDSSTGVARLALNQDRGAAIKGLHRADIFWGTGDRATLVASRLKARGRLYFLVRRD